MRLATLLVLTAALAPPALAQTEPDTTAPHRYFPLAVGNVWEYDHWETFGAPMPWRHLGYDRWIVTGETEVGGQSYSVLTTYAFSPTGAPGATETRYVRFDPARAVVLERRGAAEEIFPFVPCELDGPFRSTPIFCDETPWFSREGRGYGQPVLGTSTSVKRFGAVNVSFEVAAGIGFVRESGSEDKGLARRIDLVYARVGGVRYGTPVPVLPVVVAAEPGAPRTALAAGPNPTAGPLTLTLALPAAGPITVEAFDVMGRQVHLATYTLAAGTHALDVDAVGWAPGVYVVRATTADGVATARIVRH